MIKKLGKHVICKYCGELLSYEDKDLIKLYSEYSRDGYCSYERYEGKGFRCPECDVEIIVLN